MIQRTATYERKEEPIKLAQLSSSQMEILLKEINLCIQILTSGYKKNACKSSLFNTTGLFIGLSMLLSLLGKSAYLESDDGNSVIPIEIMLFGGSGIAGIIAHSLFLKELKEPSAYKALTSTLYRADYKKVEDMAIKLGIQSHPDTIHDRLQYFKFIQSELRKMIGMRVFSMYAQRKNVNPHDIPASVEQFLLCPR